MSKLRLGIIGVGNIGSSHFKHVVGGKCPDIVITAVADRREARRNWVVENFAEIKVEAYEADMPVIFNEGDELIASGLVDAILIAVPHYFHPYFAKTPFIPYRKSNRPLCCFDKIGK